MDWLRIRQAATKLDIKLARIDLPSAISARMLHMAREAGIDPERDRLVYMQRAGNWYVEFGLDVNPPEDAVENMRALGWEFLNAAAD